MMVAINAKYFDITMFILVVLRNTGCERPSGLSGDFEPHARVDREG